VLNWVIERPVKLYVGGRPTFFTFWRFFQISKNMTFTFFLSCCTRFFEHCEQPWSELIFPGRFDKPDLKFQKVRNHKLYFSTLQETCHIQKRQSYYRLAFNISKLLSKSAKITEAVASMDQNLPIEQSHFFSTSAWLGTTLIFSKCCNEMRSDTLIRKQ